MRIKYYVKNDTEWELINKYFFKVSHCVKTEEGKTGPLIGIIMNNNRVSPFYKNSDRNIDKSIKTVNTLEEIVAFYTRELLSK